MFPFGMNLIEKEDYLEKEIGVKDRLKQLQMVCKSFFLGYCIFASTLELKDCY